MKKIYLAVTLIIAGIAAAGTWTEYPVYLPGTITHIGEISVNPSGRGGALPGGPGQALGPTLGLINGAWAYYPAPIRQLAGISAAVDDDTLYAIENTSPLNIDRLRPPGGWEIIARPGDYGFSSFGGVAGVSFNKWWAIGNNQTTHKDGVVYYEQGKPAQVWDLGATDYPSRYIVIPRTANPMGEAYAVVRTWSSYNDYRWALYVLKPGGSYSRYWIPATNHYCDGLVSPQPGEVRLAMTPVGASGGTVIFKFSNGVFTQLQTFPERVMLRCYPSASEGWGHASNGSKVYHWSDAGFSNTYTLPGCVEDLDFVSPSDGWAVGWADTGGTKVPKMWHYTSSGAAVAPASLGRVKAAFK